MAAEARPERHHPIVFGPFEFDEAAGSLHKHGIRIRLQGQPLRILSLLVQHSGKLVTRNDFKRELWPGGGFGDFESGLNAAVNRLRQALGDSAEQPRYIETVAGQGYRFLAPIQRAEAKPVLSMTTTAVSESLPGTHHPHARKLAWLAAFATILALGTLVFLRFRETASAEQRSVRFQILPTEKSGIDSFKLSPDGRLLAFTSGGRLWVRPLDTLHAIQLPETDGASALFWSPDSRFIAFFAHGKLRKIAASGGPSQVVCDALEAHGGTWNSDGVIVLPLRLNSGLFRVSANGGDPAPLVSAGDSRSVSGIQPEFLPDGRHFIYLRFGKLDETGIYAGSLDGTAAIRLIPAVYSNVSYVPAADARRKDGYLLFRRGSALMAQPFNPARLSFTGDPSVVAQNVNGNLLSAAFSVSENGTLVYAAAADTSDYQLAWLDRTGKQLQTFGPPGSYGNFRLSPDQKRLAFAIARDNNMDVSVMNSVTGITSRLTFDPEIDDPPMWSPDGSRVVWAGYRDGAFDLYIKSLDGTGAEQLLVRMRSPAGWPEDWSRDGRYIIYEIPGTKTGQDLWIAPQSSKSENGDHKPFPFSQTVFDERHGRFSPDGRWIVFTSNESGRDEVYVQTFPESGAKLRISRDGGIEPQWGHDGKELFYISEDRVLTATSVGLPGLAGEPLQVGQAKRLFSVPVMDTFIMGRSYEVSSDGKRFLLRLASGSTAPLTVVLNWQMQLKR